MLIFPCHSSTQQTTLTGLRGASNPFHSREQIRPRVWNEPKLLWVRLQDFAVSGLGHNLGGELAKDADLTVVNDELYGILVLAVNLLKSATRS